MPHEPPNGFIPLNSVVGGRRVPDTCSVVDSPFVVPPEWVAMAAALNGVAGTLRTYLQTPPAAWPDSIVARERAREDEFARLPRTHPVMDATIQPLMYLGSSQDHLTALAATMCTEGTVMAYMTLLRTQLVGAGCARYLADPKIELRERMRRWINVHLDSLTEQMHLVGADDVPAFEALSDERKAIVDGARALGWSPIVAPSPMNRWPKDWYVGDKPLGEGELIDRVLPQSDKTRIGHRLYRLLSATSHVQPHGMLSFINQELVKSHGDGSATARVGMDGRTLSALALCAVGSLTVAMQSCFVLYGWDSELWDRNVIPLLRDLRSALPPS